MLSKEARIDKWSRIFEKDASGCLIFTVKRETPGDIPEHDRRQWRGSEHRPVLIDGEYLEYAGENSVMFDEHAGRGIAMHEPELGLSYPAAASVDMTVQFARSNRLSAGSWESAL